MAGFFEPGPANPQPLNFGGVNVQPAFDVIELLPPAAAERLRQLRQRAADVHAVVPEFETVRQASMARIEAANALKRLTDHQQYGGFNLKEDSGSVIAAQRTLDKATADFKRLQELKEVRTAQWQTVSQAPTACESWLRDGRPHGTVLEDCEAEPVKLLKGEGILDAVERHRRRVRELKADLHRISSSPFPSGYAKEQMRAMVEQLAQHGAPSVSLLIEHDREIVWPMQQVQVQVHNAQPGAVGFAEVPDTVALFAWLHGPALIKRLDAEIEAESDDAASLSHAERQKLEAEVLSDLLAVERDEAALVWQAQAQGLPVEHRADINPLALLGVMLVTAPTAVTPGTSPGFSFTLNRPGAR